MGISMADFDYTDVMLSYFLKTKHNRFSECHNLFIPKEEYILKTPEEHINEIVLKSIKPGKYTFTYKVQKEKDRIPF